MFNVKDTFISLNNIRAPAVISSDGANLIESKNQFNFSFEQRFSEFWSFTTSSTFDKKNKIKFHDINAKVKYEDECVGFFSFNWKRQYTHNPEDPTSNSFLFYFHLKKSWKMIFKKVCLIATFCHVFLLPNLLIAEEKLKH